MTTAERLTMSLGEAMFTQRAIRRLKPDPIPDEVMRDIMESAIRAPNGGNTQQWHFIVLKDADKRKQMGELYHEAWWAKRRDAYGWTSKADIPEDSVYRLPALLADEMVNAPTIILVYSEQSGVAASSTFPGVQNLLLAARALGLGSVLTTLHPQVMERVNAMFDVPEEMEFHCCIPIGYPRGKFGPTSRLPTSATTSWGRWGQPPPW